MMEESMTFEDLAALVAWLAAAGVPLERWGQGGAKTPADLWAELASGETTLTDDPPRRAVTVVQVLIQRGERQLTELEQEMADGRRRARGWPPSEKLKGGEGVLGAARRCLLEELSLVVPDAALYEAMPPYDRAVDSPSYPGLVTIYHVHSVAATTDALPDDDFWLDNTASADPVRRHLWGWR